MPIYHHKNCVCAESEAKGRFGARLKIREINDSPAVFPHGHRLDATQGGSTDTKRLAQSSLTTVLASSHCQFLFISIKIIFMVNRKLQFLPAPLKSCYQQWPMWCFQNGGPSSEPFLHTLTRYQLKLWTCAFGTRDTTVCSILTPSYLLVSILILPFNVRR